MKILIINPNSSVDMTADIQAAALAYAAGDFEVETLPTEGAPAFIGPYIDAAMAAPGMMDIVRKNEDRVDAFIVACHCDPNLDLIKEISKKPVVGIGEASMKLASMLGHKFSVIAVGTGGMRNKEALIHRYFLTGAFCSIRSPERTDDLHDAEAFIEAGRRAVEDGAEVLVLGCAGLCGLAKTMSEALGVPVIDSVVAALIIAEGLVKAGLNLCRTGRYKGR